MKTKKLKLHQYNISKLEKISRNKKIICFGSGNNLTHIFSAMQDLQIEDRVHYIVDNDSRKWGKNRVLNGQNFIIKNPTELKFEDWDSNILIIAIVAYHVILEQLEELLKGTNAVCLVSPIYRYWYDKIIDRMTLRQPIQNAIVLQGEGDTCENAKALIQAFRTQKSYADYRIAWLYDGIHHGQSHIESNAEKYFVRDLPIKKHSLKEIYEYYSYINRARFLIYENKMIPKARGEQIACYMNHGIPLKCTKGKIVVYKDTNYVLSPSESTDDIICEQYDADQRQILTCGAPRTDCLFKKEKHKKLTEYLHLGQYKKMVLWAPTFRVHENYSRKDSEKQFRFGIPLLEQDADYKTLLEALNKNNILLVIKPHIHEELSELTMNEATHIRILKQEVLDELESNVYDLMKLADAMITDYSSIGFDYLLLDRPLGYTIDDIEQYTIGFSVPNPLEYMPGAKMKKIDDLLAFLDSVACNCDDYAEDRKNLKDKLHTYQDGGNSVRLLKLLGLV